MRVLAPVQAHELDQISIIDLEISGEVLMENAGLCIAEKAIKMVEGLDDPSILIISGKGNNGGDGLVAAKKLADLKYKTSIIITSKMVEYKDSSLMYYLRCKESKIPITFTLSLSDICTPDLIIDGILGTGFEGALRGELISIINWINQSNSMVLSIDIPSGLNGRSGKADPIAVKADSTVTFGSYKLGMIFHNGREYSGNVEVPDIGFPELAKVDLSGLHWDMYTNKDANKILNKPNVSSNKYSAGKVLVIAGSRGMTGAAILATYGALRSGAGSTITTAPSSLNEIYERSILEGMTLPLIDKNSGILELEHFELIMEKVDWADSVVIGPGMGRDKNTQKLIKKLVQTIKKPLVLDADGLFPFNGEFERLNERKSPLIITPHFGELSRLIGKNKKLIIDKFPDIMKDFMERYNHNALVKQIPSCSFYKNNVLINSSGNPGLATAGTGDILSGMVASFNSQGLDLNAAAPLASFIHGRASDNLVQEKGYRGQVASDLLGKIPEVISNYEIS